MDNNKEGVNKSTWHEKKDRIGSDFKENSNTQCCMCKNACHNSNLEELINISTIVWDPCFLLVNFCTIMTK
jgi:hypothetical protein